MRPWLTAQALVYALNDLALTLGGGGPYREEAARIEATLPKLYGQIRSLMDSDEDNHVSQERQPVSPVLILSSGRSTRYRG